MAGDRSRRRDLVAAFSLANLCLADVWAALLPSAISAKTLYYMAGPPPPIQYAVALSLLGLLTALIGAVLRGLRARDLRLVWASRLLGLAILAVAANALRIQLPAGVANGAAVWLVGVGGLGAAAWLVSRSPPRVRSWLSGIRSWLNGIRSRVGFRSGTAALTRGLLVFAPFAVVCTVQALWGVVAAPGGGEPARLRPPVGSAPPSHAPERRGSRVVVLLFDELDYRLAFEARPEGIALPALDGLRAASFDAREAHPPGASTAISVPSLLMGEPVASAEPGGAAELLLRREAGGPAFSWRRADTLFSRAHEDGRSVGVVGWYHPYCRLFADVLRACSWHPAAPFTPSAGEAGGAFRQQLEILGFSVPGAFRLLGGRAAETRYHRVAYDTVLSASERQIADPALDLVYLHLPVPHTPVIWDATADRFRSAAGGSYADNLVLADRTWERLERRLAGTGLGDRTWILLTSDHHWRRSGSSDPRVPFLLRAPDSRRGIAFAPRLETRLTPDLVIGILRSEIHSLAQATRWIEARAAESAAPSPPR